MNKNKAILAGAAMVALTMPLAQKEAHAAAATINASAVVVDAIQLAAGTGLHFGTMSITGAGTVTVSTASARSAGSGGLNPITGVGSEQAGSFTLTMPDGAADFDVAFPISLTASLTVDAVYLNLPGVGPVTLTSGAAAAASQAITGAATGAAIAVGGRLRSSGAIAAGTYSAALVLTATYP